MRTLPYSDPGTPAIEGPWRFLGWIAKGQRTTLAIGMVWGIIWMVAQALIPVAVGRGIAQGVVTHDLTALLLWSGAVLGLVVVRPARG